MDNILKSIFPYMSDTEKKQVFYIHNDDEDDEDDVKLTKQEIEDIALESVREEERRGFFINKALKNKKRRRK